MMKTCLLLHLVVVQVAAILLESESDIARELRGRECREKTCIPRCCQKGEVLKDSGGILECIPERNSRAQDRWIPPLWNYESNNVTVPVDSIRFLQNFPSCANGSRLQHFSSYSAEGPQIMSDGHLLLHRGNISVGQLQYCVEVGSNPGHYWTQVCVMSQNMTKPLIIPKCCPIGQDFSDHTMSCVPTIRNATDWMPDTVRIRQSRLIKRKIKPHELTFGLPSCPPTHMRIRIKVDDGIPFEQRYWVMTTGGQLLLAQNPHEMLSWRSFCIDRVHTDPNKIVNNYYVAHACVPDPYSVCVNDTCVSKCCPPGLGMLFDPPFCAPVTEDWQPTFYERGFWDVFNVDKDPNEVVYVNQVPNCVTGSFPLDPTVEDANDVFFILSDGKLLVARYRQKYGQKEYCVDKMADGTDREVALLCFPEDKQNGSPEDRFTYVFYSIALLISSLFLLATFVVYAVLPELQNLHGKTLLSHVASLFFAYLFLSISQIGGDTLPISAPAFCKADAVLMHFFFLSSFFWLSAMCFDIWWTFSGLRPLRGGAGERDRKKFMIYSVYSWGCAFIVSLVAIVMDFAPGISPFFLKPVFGLRRCWFIGEWEQFVYFYGPIAFLLLTNMILFSLTAWKLIIVHRETKMLTDNKGNNRHSGKGSKRDKERQRLMLYLKLFIVMGMTWVMEVVSWAVGGPTYYWYLSDVPNIMQGVLIFVIFVCKRKIFRLLKGKLLSSRLSWKPSTNTSTSRAFSTTNLGSMTQSTVTSSVADVPRRKVCNNDHIQMDPVARY